MSLIYPQDVKQIDTSKLTVNQANAYYCMADEIVHGNDSKRTRFDIRDLYNLHTDAEWSPVEELLSKLNKN